MRSTRPDLMCAASPMPTMNARMGQTWAIAAASLRCERSMAKKMTLPVCTLANTPPRTK
jgi:hypothetical protein